MVLYRVNGLSYREFLEIKLGKTFKTYSLQEILTNHIEIVYKDFIDFKPLEYLNYCYCNNQEIGTIRETYFTNQLALLHDISVQNSGNFLVDDKYAFEIGGKNKNFNQIKDMKNSFVVADDKESGFGNKLL